MRVNYVGYDTPQFRRLSDDQLERVHNASLEILERTGVRLHHQPALEMLKGAGVEVVDGNLVYVPARLVEWAIGAAPSRVVLCDREGRWVMPLERGRVFFGPGSDCPYVLDHRTGERRHGTLKDIAEGIRVCDALHNIDFLMSLCIPADVRNPEVADRYQMRAMLANSTKPILFVTLSLRGCQDAVAMAEAVAGGAGPLRRNPLCASYINVSAPLRHNEEALEKLLFMAQKGLPTTYTPMVLRGVSGPITRAGAMAMANAGELVGLVLAQLTREGTPVIHSGGYHDMFDMRTTVGIYESPEGRSGRAELARYYDLPVFGLGGASDSKVPDQQAAAEAALSLLIESLYGVNLIHDVGYLESGKCYSLEQLVLCDEIIAYVRRFVDEMEVNEETLALDLIDEVGHEGDFLGTDHTMRHFREDWYPALFNRQDFEDWSAAGGHDVRHGARERVEEILSGAGPTPLPGETMRRLDDMVAGAGP